MKLLPGPGAPLPLRVGCELRCPGCTHRQLTADGSEKQKQDWLARRLEPWLSALEPIRGLADPEARWSYRRKTTLRAEWDGSRWHFGLRRRIPGTREYDLIAIPDCPVHSRLIQEVLEFLSGFLPGPPVLPLEFVTISGTLLTLVVKAAGFPRGLDLWTEGSPEAGRAAELGLRGVHVNFNPSAGERVYSNRGWLKLWGDSHARLETRSLGSWRYGPSSFQQLLPGLHENALKEASAFLRPQPGDSVADLYSGIGISLGLWKGVRAMGVELNGEAVECAQENLGAAAVILRGRVSERLPQLEEWRRQARGDFLAFANPPRLGLEPEVTRWLAERARPRRIAYLSCSAGTLARDLSTLCEGRYVVKRIIPYDFFPQTLHVETLALLEQA